MIVNSHLFEAFLECSTKCWLRSRAEPTAGNIYVPGSVAAETDPIYERVANVIHDGGVGAVRALRGRHQSPQTRAQRRNPGAQLPDAGDLSRRRRHRRRFAAARDEAARATPT